MKLPNGDRAQVDVRKLTDYLLSPTHPRGSLKARLFRRLGFDESTVASLETELKRIAEREDVVQLVLSKFGEKYVVDGVIISPLEYEISIRTVWIREPGEEAPRFVTAYPLSERGGVR